MTGTASGQPGRKRSAARLAAVQALYQIELTGGSAANVVREFLMHRFGGGEDDTPGAADEALFADLVEGASARRDELDRQISAVLTPDWPLARLEVILRAILRAGAYELIARPDVPARVAISEYIDIAHAFLRRQGAWAGKRRSRCTCSNVPARGLARGIG